MRTAPGFWWEPPGRPARLLAPAAALYGIIAGRRMDRAPRRLAGLPLLLVGNFTLGGAGKTPTVLALAQAALAMGRRPGFVTRGHGGTETRRGARLVDLGRDGAQAVGDEALLLAAGAPTAAGADRLLGARLLREAGCDLLLMDDGFQSARLGCDLSLVVVDAKRALGNRRVFPAGPLRAPLAVQLRHTDAILLVGEGDVPEAFPDDIPRHRAALEAANGELFAERTVLAFAGIGDPEKFRRSLLAAGARVRALRAFPDHHPFTESEAAALLAEAERQGLQPATTRKDHVRLLAGGLAARRLAARSLVLDVRLRFADGRIPEALIAETLRRFAVSSGGAAPD